MAVLDFARGRARRCRMCNADLTGGGICPCTVDGDAYIAWCLARGFEPLPVDRTVARLYLGGLPPERRRAAAAAIQLLHLEIGENPIPDLLGDLRPAPAASPGFRVVWSGGEGLTATGP